MRYSSTGFFLFFTLEKILAEKIKKKDLVNSIFEKNDIDKKIVSDVIDSLLDELKSNLQKKATIELRGFGTFELRLRKEKKSARNPKTGEKISVPKHYVAAFRPGVELKANLLKLNISDEN